MREDSSSSPAPSRRELMSRLADGDLPSAEDACRVWRDDPTAREAWAAYHLIGDTLRSDELAGCFHRSEVFLSGFRRRLADEPVVLAPAAPTGPRRPAHWSAPAAIAAGVAAVAVTLLVLQDSGPAPARAPALAAASGAPSLTAITVSAATPAGEPQWQAAHRKLIRDERLDAYLRAHRGAPEAVPGAASGRFETVVLER
jgi:sigma-E factor negative regulatory protein RseA